MITLGAGKCLDLPSSANGTQAVISDCSGATTQWWIYHPLTQQLVVQLPGGLSWVDKCLDIAADGTKAVINGCDGSANQRWVMAAGSEGISRTVQSVCEGKCLTLPGTGTVTAAGTKVEVQPCRDSDDPATDLLQINQQWVGP